MKKNIIKEYCEEILNIHESETLNAIEKCASIVTFKKGDIIFNYGDILKDILFIKSGMVLDYSHNREDNMIIGSFLHVPGTPLLWSAELENAEPCTCIAKAKNKVECVAIPLEEILKLLPQSEDLKALYLKSIKYYYDLNHEKGYILTLSVDDKIKYFEEHFQDIKDIVSDKDIASFLDISYYNYNRKKNKK